MPRVAGILAGRKLIKEAVKERKKEKRTVGTKHDNKQIIKKRVKLSKSSLLQLGGPSAMKHSQLLARLMEGMEKKEADERDAEAEKDNTNVSQTMFWYRELQEDPEAKYVQTYFIQMQGKDLDEGEDEDAGAGKENKEENANESIFMSKT